MKFYCTLTAFFLVVAVTGKAQKVQSVMFNLYTDSLKKGVHNYISVDGKMTNGKFYPLMTDEVEFTSSAGKWEGNSIILDSSYNKDSVVISVKLKADTALTQSLTIYIKKVEETEVLKTEQELFESWKRKQKKS